MSAELVFGNAQKLQLQYSNLTWQGATEESMSGILYHNELITGKSVWANEGMAVDGGVELVNPSKNASTAEFSYYYIDLSGCKQGPHSHSQMRSIGTTKPSLTGVLWSR